MRFSAFSTSASRKIKTQTSQIISESLKTKRSLCINQLADDRSKTTSGTKRSAFLYRWSWIWSTKQPNQQNFAEYVTSLQGLLTRFWYRFEKKRHNKIFSLTVFRTSFRQLWNSLGTNCFTILSYFKVKITLCIGSDKIQRVSWKIWRITYDCHVDLVQKTVTLSTPVNSLHHKPPWRKRSARDVRREICLESLSTVCIYGR